MSQDGTLSDQGATMRQGSPSLSDARRQVVARLNRRLQICLNGPSLIGSPLAVFGRYLDTDTTRERSDESEHLSSFG